MLIGLRGGHAFIEICFRRHRALKHLRQGWAIVSGSVEHVFCVRRRVHTSRCFLQVVLFGMHNPSASMPVGGLRGGPFIR